MDKKNMYYILAAVAVVVVIVLFFVMRQPSEAPAPTPEAPVVPEAPVLPEAEVPTTYAGEEMVSNAVCADGKVGAIITNVASNPVTLATDVKFLIRGLVVKTPGCDKTELGPGESTTCTTLNGPFPVVSGKNEVVIRMTGAKEGLATVTCQ